MVNLQWYGDKVASELEKKMLDGAEEWMRADVQPDADEHCPFKEGVLSGSHYVERKERYVVIGYGGPASEYAEIQHEDMSLSHGKGKTAKWLENAANNQIGKLSKKINDRIK
jgi:hypothetical protein